MLDSCLGFILVKSWIWIFWWFIGTLKYMAMVVVSIFVGPGKTIHRLAASNTQRKTGMPWDVTPDIYKVEKVKVTLWMLWATAYWLFIIGMVAYNMMGGLS